MGSGGAIAKTDGTLILEDVLLEENVALLSGGAIFTADVFIDANACRLDGNWVTEGEVGGWQISHPVDESVIVDVEVGNTQGSGIGVAELDAVLTFRSCLFWDNESSGSGGGLQILGDDPADALVEDCEFHGNISGSWGGGLRSDCQTAVFNCLFLFNQAEDGGGLFSADGHLVNNVFTDNIATGGNPSRGGGAYLNDGMVFDNRFERNTADNGGGLYVRDLIVPLTGGIFLDNTATEGGGGLYVGTGEVDTSTFVRNHANRGGGLYHEDHYVWHSVFWDNSVDGNGAAVLTPTQSYLIQCTIVGNTVISEEPRGAQVVAWREWDEPVPALMPALHRCIAAFGHNCGVLDMIHEDFPWPQKDMPEEPSRLAYCSLIYGNDIGYWSDNDPSDLDCIASDPLFCDLEAGDLTLHSNSPALPENNDCGDLMGFFGVGCTVASGVEDSLPSAVTALLGNHPNPFNPSTTVEFALARDGQVVLEVVDLKGRRVARLVSEHRSAGQHTVRWDGRDDAGREVPSGIYLARLVAAGSVSAHRLALIR
jgi:hypothetical protein